MCHVCLIMTEAMISSFGSWCWFRARPDRQAAKHCSTRRFACNKTPGYREVLLDFRILPHSQELSRQQAGLVLADILAVLDCHETTEEAPWPPSRSCPGSLRVRRNAFATHAQPKRRPAPRADLPPSSGNGALRPVKISRRAAYANEFRNARLATLARDCRRGCRDDLGHHNGRSRRRDSRL